MLPSEGGILSILSSSVIIIVRYRITVLRLLD